jgi:ABC-type dipeptide/oligopeptide/nickel transport system ATPase component
VTLDDDVIAAMMYLGTVVEEAPAKALSAHPRLDPSRLDLASQADLNHRCRQAPSHACLP